MQTAFELQKQCKEINGKDKIKKDKREIPWKYYETHPKQTIRNRKKP